MDAKNCASAGPGTRETSESSPNLWCRAAGSKWRAPIGNPNADSLNRRKQRQQSFSFSVLCSLRSLLCKNSCVQRYIAKKEQMPVMQQKPGLKSRRYAPMHCPARPAPLGNEVRGQQSDFPISVFSFSDFQRLPRHANSWSEDFTAKLLCNVAFWLKRLPKLIGSSENLSKGPCLVRQADSLIISSG